MLSRTSIQNTPTTSPVYWGWALRQLPTCEEVNELRDHVRRLNDAQRVTGSKRASPAWDLISFSASAISDSIAWAARAGRCQCLPASARSRYNRCAPTSRILSPTCWRTGSGKSARRLPSCHDFAEVVAECASQLEDASAVDDLTLPPDDPCLLLIDDAHPWRHVRRCSRLEETSLPAAFCALHSQRRRGWSG